MRLNTMEWGNGDRIAVLMHGMMGNAQNWYRVGPDLAARGYRVIATDALGHGGSPRDPHATIDSLVDALAETVPAGPAVAIGHSMGGVLMAAAVRAGRFAPGRAIYIDTPFDASAGGVTPEAARAQHEGAKKGRTLEYLRARRSWWSEEERLIEVEAARQFDAETAISLSLSGSGRDFTPPTDIPSLMVLADPSDYVSPEYADHLRAIGFEVRGVAGAGHSVWYGLHDEFMAALDGWV